MKTVPTKALTVCFFNDYLDFSIQEYKVIEAKADFEDVTKITEDLKPVVMTRMPELEKHISDRDQCEQDNRRYVYVLVSYSNIQISLAGCQVLSISIKVFI